MRVVIIGGTGHVGSYLAPRRVEVVRGRVYRYVFCGRLHNMFRIADYGLHIIYNTPSLVNKTPLSPAGNPWKLEANRDSIYGYDRGTCPMSDALFARTVLLPVPSRLTREQEAAAAEIVEQAVAAARR
jgi:hypothetical protein